MARALLDPRMFPNLTGYFRQRCTVYEATAEQDADGQVRNTWAAVENRRDIPCMLGVLPGQANQSEMRRFQQTVSIETQAVLLRGHYPDITDRHRVVISGYAFNVTGCDTESQQELTRLRVERVR